MSGHMQAEPPQTLHWPKGAPLDRQALLERGHRLIMVPKFSKHVSYTCVRVGDVRVIGCQDTELNAETFLEPVPHV